MRIRKPAQAVSARIIEARVNVHEMAATMTCSQASKKKNFETMKVLTSMTEDAATTASRATMLTTRMPFSTTYPAPANDLPKIPIPKNLMSVVLYVVCGISLDAWKYC